MGLVVTGEGMGISEDLERRSGEQVARLRCMFTAEPEVRVVFSSKGAGNVHADVVVGIRGYQTLKARGKGEDEATSLEAALKKVEWKYRLFWTRGSFRFSDCC